MEPAHELDSLPLLAAQDSGTDKGTRLSAIYSGGDEVRGPMPLLLWVTRIAWDARTIVLILGLSSLWLFNRRQATLISDVQTRQARPATYMRLGDTTATNFDSMLSMMGADMFVAECLQANFVLEVGGFPGSTGKKVTDLLSTSTIADVSKVCWLRYGNEEFLNMLTDGEGKCVDIVRAIFRRLHGVLQGCTTIIRVGNGTQLGEPESLWDTGSYARTLVGGIAVSRLCGTLPVKNKAMVYLERAHHSDHLLTMLKSAAALSHSQQIDLFTSDVTAVAAIAANAFPGVRVMTRSPEDDLEDLCSMAQYKYVVASDSIRSKIALSHQMHKKEWKIFATRPDEGSQLEEVDPFDTL